MRLPAACRQAAGLSIDEPRAAVAPTVYLFAPRAWRSTDFNDLQIKGETR